MRMKRTSILIAAALATVGVQVPASFGAYKPQSFIAVWDGNQNLDPARTPTQRSIAYYAVSDLSGSSVFAGAPVLSMWVGYEDTQGANFDEADTITVNSGTGMTYQIAFDSGAPGVVDAAGDTQGDFDLYRLNFNKALIDQRSNPVAAPKGTMYVPTTLSDGFSNIPHPTAAVSRFIDEVSVKIGEVRRNQQVGTVFFDTDAEFVRPDRIVLLENETDAALNDTVANDHTIATFERVAEVNGSGDYNAAGNTQSWSRTSNTLVDMDNGTGRSEPVDIAFVSRDGVQGVWVLESDGGGDDISFFQIDWSGSAPTLAKKELVAPGFPTGFALDEDPTVDANTNDGDGDWVKVDGAGNLLIGESGFNDTPPTEPKVIGREVVSYDDVDGRVDFGAWSTSPTLAPSTDDDSAVTDGRFTTYDPATGYLYFFDIDSGTAPGVNADVYVFDLATGSLVYQELNGAPQFLERNGIRMINRGDLTGDGTINIDDVALLYTAIDDATLGGEVSDLTGSEWYDLTGDIDLTLHVDGGLGDDFELIKNIAGVIDGDADVDGDVDFDDLGLLLGNYDQAGNWLGGDFDFTGLVDFDDLGLLLGNYGLGVVGAVQGELDAAAVEALVAAGFGSVVPEPSTAGLLVGVGAMALRRRRK